MSDSEGCNQSWTREMTSKLKQLRSMAWSYTWIHRENSTYLNDMYEWISVISYSLSFFNGVILIFPNNIIYIRIFNILLAFSAGLLVFYIKNKKFPETAERHKIASSKFSNIYNNISRQLSLDISLRETAVAYHRWITSQYENLYGTAPDIDPPIIEEYVRKFAHKRRYNPIEAAEFDRQSSNSSSSSSSSSTTISRHSEQPAEEIDDDKSNDFIIDIDLLKKKIQISDQNKNDQNTIDDDQISEGNNQSSSQINNSQINNDQWDINGTQITTASSSPPSSTDADESAQYDFSPEVMSDQLNSDNLRKIHHNRHRRSKKRHLDYEQDRFNQNTMDFMSLAGGGGMSTKCLIPEFELYSQEIKAATPTSKRDKKR